MDLTTPLVPLAAFALDPAGLHLNHGSFGACPRAVLAAQTATRDALEASPMRFLHRDWQPRLDAARARVAAAVAADPADLVFVPNPTTGVASILASRAWRAGDRVVMIDHAYRACRNAVGRLGETHGVELDTVRVALPAHGAAIVEAIVAAATHPRARLVLLDQITSPTALVLDAAAVAAGLAAAAPHVELLVDAAHCPGQIAFDLAALAAAGAHYAVATGHKWLCSPKGSSMLWARRDRRDALRPVVTSHGESPEFGPPNRFHARFDWSGTHDPTAFLALPVAIDELAAAGGGWPAIRARNHALVLAARDHLFARLGGGAAPIAPDAMHGCMAAIPIALPAAATPAALQDDLLAHGIEAPIITLAGHGSFVRISAHVYNHLAEYDRLAEALLARGVRGRPPDDPSAA